MYAATAIRRISALIKYFGASVAISAIISFSSQAEESTRSALYGKYGAPPTVVHSRCLNTAAAPACDNLLRALLYSDVDAEVSSSQSIAKATDPKIKDLIGQCRIDEGAGPFAASDPMYGPEPIFPRGPLTLFDLPSGGASESLQRTLVVARGYRRLGADHDLGWVGYYLVSREEPCAAIVVEFYESDNDLLSTQALITHEGSIYLLTLFQQEKAGRYYSGDVVQITNDGATSLIGFAVTF